MTAISGVFVESNQSVRAIYGIDFSLIERKLCLPLAEGGKYRWSLERAKDAILWYRRFLHLRLISAGDDIVPTQDIDQVWHFHILYTHQYHQDCNRIFGRYIHHNPSEGTVEERARLKQLLNKTLDLFEFHFGEKPQNLEDDCGSCCVECE